MQQLGMEDVNPEYKAFVDKFKPKKTTDDCYTPDYIYDVVADWVQERYGVERATFARPFWPGGDYERFDYAPDAVVVDNPPFSILSKICGYYQRRGIGFFLFAPSLTMFNSTYCTDGITCVCCDASITYANGAVVKTSFLTNLDKSGIVAMSEPDLHKAIDAATDRNKQTVSLPKYAYPDHVVTASMLNYMAAHDVRYTVRRSDAVFIRDLDEQHKAGKSIFGGGLLLSEKAAAEKAAAEKAAAEKAAHDKVDYVHWQLSEREREMVARLGAGE